MGFNTTIIVRNDSLGDIENDPEFGKRLVQAIKLFSEKSEGVDVAAYNTNGKSVSVNAATVVETHHCSSTALVAVGGNYANVLGWAGDEKHHTHEGQLACLKSLAESMGFTLVKKGK